MYERARRLLARWYMTANEDRQLINDTEELLSERGPGG
jgi:hypothetical protein